MTGGGLGSRPLHAAGVGCGKGVDMSAVSLVQALERVFPQGPVRGSLQQDIVGTGDFVLLSLAVQCRIKEKVGILKVVGDLPGSGKDLPETCQQLFFRGGEGMGFPPDELIHLEPVGDQTVIPGDLFQFFFGKGEDLRDGKRGL